MQADLLERINAVAVAVSNLAERMPHVTQLAIMAWAMDDVANIAHARRVRPLLASEGNLTLTEETPPEPANTAESLVLAYLKDNPGATIRAVAAAGDYSPEYMSQVLNRLHRQGAVIRSAKLTRVAARWWLKGGEK